MSHCSTASVSKSDKLFEKAYAILAPYIQLVHLVSYK